VRTRKAKTWERLGESLQEQKQPYWPDSVEADFGGGGLFATADDLLKIYQGILTEKLLRPESVKEMFQPHLETPKGLDKPAEYSLPSRNAIWNTVPDDVPVSFGIGGLLNTTAVPKRRGVNSLTWTGLPNCYWVGPDLVKTDLAYHQTIVDRPQQWCRRRVPLSACTNRR
jgi:CubicO group peptidase (beta-lactamase class C family)